MPLERRSTVARVRALELVALLSSRRPSSPLRRDDRYRVVSDEFSPLIHRLQRPFSRNQTTVDVKVFFGHSSRGKAFFEDAADPSAVELIQPSYSCLGLGLVLDDEAGHSIINDFRNRAVAKCDHRGAAR